MNAILNLPSRMSALGLGFGLIFLAASFTPTLIPRGPEVQGALGGAAMALGYLAGRIVEAVWEAADMPSLTGRIRRGAVVVASICIVALLVQAIRYSTLWQNDIRERMGMEPVAGAYFVIEFLVFAGVAAVLFGLGKVVSLFFRFVRARLYKVMPPRRANVLGTIIVILALFAITRDGLLDTAINVMDETFEANQELFDRAPPAPIDPRVPGSQASLVDWSAMGQPGRSFVTSGPDADAIQAFTGRPAKDPIRVYVGRANGNTPEERAKLALDELLRLGAFQRKVLVVVSPTGTGWMDPGSHDPLEYMHGGDIATVAVQYSYMQSPFALVFETRTGLDQASATVATIYEHWRHLPRRQRPRLYIHGLSLGAWSSMYATTLVQLVNDPIDGAFWVGPPFPSDFWIQMQRSRNQGSPWVQPTIGDGSVIRFASRTDDGSEAPGEWGDMRIIFLQYPSDAIVFFEPQSFWRRPVWMNEPVGAGVSPHIRFVPIVTQLQLALDMAISTSVPAGFGHSYFAQDYIVPWAEVTRPESWTTDDTERLKRHCDNGFQNGCSNE